MCANGTATTCAATEYIANNACTQCPHGFRCDGVNRFACGVGNYSLAGDGVCTECPAGSSLNAEQ